MASAANVNVTQGLVSSRRISKPHVQYHGQVNWVDSPSLSRYAPPQNTKGVAFAPFNPSVLQTQTVFVFHKHMILYISLAYDSFATPYVTWNIHYAGHNLDYLFQDICVLPVSPLNQHATIATSATEKTQPSANILEAP